MINKDSVHKILVIKFGGIGDVLLSTAVLPNLRDYFPNAVIEFLTLYKCRDVLSDNPYINRYMTFEIGKDNSYYLVKVIKKKNYDLILDLYCNPRTAFLTYYSRAKYRVGFDFPKRKYAYNIKIKATELGGSMHNVDFNLLPLKTLEIPIIKKELSISVTKYHKENAIKYLNNNQLNGKSLIGIPIAGGWESKKYKVKDYIELLRKIKLKYDVEFLLMWGNESELNECRSINNVLKEYTHIIPDLSIRYLAALMQECKLIIRNDSGPLHIAAAAGVPVLGIYGPTSPDLQGPFGDKNLAVVNKKLDCLNCALLECNIDNICMKELSKEEIMLKLDELINMNSITI